MRRFVALTLIALAFVATACADDDQPSGSTPANPGASQNGETAQASGGAAATQGPIEVGVTANGFDPVSAKVTVGQDINFNNTDSKPHTIEVPSGREQVVAAGETFTYKVEGCCGATFTDKETGAEFEITVSREAAGLSG
jgi:plastocyanin